VNVLVVGSVALDSVETPFGSAEWVVGGSATYFASAACHLTKVELVGVVGDDYPIAKLAPLVEHGVDISGLERVRGESFRWRGRYRHDLNSAETLETRLGVFSDFHPRIPPAFRRAPYVFLANIDPQVQLEVLGQVTAPRFVACDTMNFWIENRRDDLMTVLGKVDLITVNDGEARQLTGRTNLVHAARWILDHGPRYVIIKKGEHGALLFSPASVFFAPAYPLESVFDPTGAGDAFAGGFMGHLAKTDDLAEANLRRAVVIGAAMGSFAVERFSNDRLLALTPVELARRISEFRALVAVEERGQKSPGDGADGATSGLESLSPDAGTR
jgi:sugar/nucleoside kinase (ribokinase family)